jgi:HD-like signal output (HDOD) protein
VTPGAATLPPELLELERAIQELADRGGLRIPPYPAVAARVQEAMSRRDFGLAEVAQLVGADAVLAADILRCANSAMYRRGAPVADLLQAITRIGAQEVMRLLLASGLAASGHALGPLVSMRRIVWIEGLASAAVCQELARLRGLRTEEAFVLGLLHDVGRVVVAASLEALIEQGRAQGRWPLEAWTALVDRQHVPVGLATAAHWGLPPLVAEVIATHHGAPGRCRDPRLLEVVRLSDEVVSLVVTRTRVTGADLARIPGIGPAERDAVERVIENIPEFVAAFETPAAAAAVTSPVVAVPETTLAGEGRPARIGVSIQVARRPRLFTVSSVLPDGLAMTGEEPVPENRLLEAKVYAERPFQMWVLTRLCRKVPEGYLVEVQPFGLSVTQRELWETLAAGPAARA